MANKIELQTLKLSQYAQLLESMKAAYNNWNGSYWSLESIEKLLKIFPEGQFVVMVDDVVVGCALTLIIDYKKFGDNHTYKQITGGYTFKTHNPDGNILYGIEVFIHPEYRGLRLGRRLYDARKELCEKLNLESIIFGGRIPNYHKYVDSVSPREYIEKVKRKEIFDPVLSFQMSNDFHVKKLLKNYMPEDEESQENAVLLQWHNVYFTKSNTKTTVRLGLVQWQMRPYNDIEELFQQVEYFVDSVSAYQSDFALFPEYFNAPLLAKYNHLSEAEAMRKLAEHTPAIKAKFSELAMSYNVNIISGSMPMIENGTLNNIGFVCHRSGKVEQYKKIHVTPDEFKYWGLTGGNIVQSYDTDAGRIGVLICYDVEFPELGRKLAEDRIQILFVPFMTDTQNSYFRVRCCSQARAIENECYVAITGSVGNLPKVENMDIHYSQAAVFTPSDFSFPSNAIKSEASANTEMLLIADVDLSLLDQLHTYGSVRNLKDRRKDLYNLAFENK